MDDIDIKGSAIFYRNLRLYGCHARKDIDILKRLIIEHLYYIDILATVCRGEAATTTQLTITTRSEFRCVMLDIYKGNGSIELCILEQPSDISIRMLLHCNGGAIFGSPLLCSVISDPLSISSTKSIIDEFLDDSELFIAKHA